MVNTQEKKLKLYWAEVIMSYVGFLVAFSLGMHGDVPLWGWTERME